MSLGCWLAILGGVGLIAFLLISNLHKKVATKPDPSVRIVAFELAGSGLTAYDMLESWSEAGRQVARRCLKIDSGIIAGYVGAFIGFGGVAVAVAADRSQCGWRTAALILGSIGVAAGVVAGVADMMENVALRKVLTSWQPYAGPVTDPPAVKAPKVAAHRRECAAQLHPFALAAAQRARVKFALIVVGGVAILAAGTILYAAR